jgi:ABC-type transport system involved in cytochrome c biogenesis permease subunit
MWINIAYALMWASVAGYIWFLRSKERFDEWWALGVLGAAWVSLTVGLVQRGLDAGYWPLTNRYEALLCLVWVILGVYLALDLSWGERQAGIWVLAVAILAATDAIFQPAAGKAILPLLAVLHSPWQQLHSLSAAFGYGILGVAGGLGLRRSWIYWRARRSPAAPGQAHLAKIDAVIEGLLDLSLICLTAALLTGAIWTQAAFGRYFAWEPAEIWGLVAWLACLLANHARLSQSWRGQKITWIAIAGLALVAITYAGVPWIIQLLKALSIQGY